MKAYVLKRLLLMIPTLLGITFLAYAIVRLAPGDPIAAMIRAQSGNIDPRVMHADAERIRERLGLKDYDYFGDGRIDRLDKVIGVFHGYARWFGHLVTGDFGESIKFRTSGGSRNPVLLFLERIPITLTLNIIAEILVFFIAIPVGLASARYQGRFFDRSSGALFLVLWSVPEALAGTLLLGVLARGGVGLGWFPVAWLHSPNADEMGWAAYMVDTLWHATLPVLCMVYGGLAYLAKLGRASLLENLRADYVRTARAKGLPEERVIYHHALRNSLLPMITALVLSIPGLIGGSVIVEYIFSIQGTGLLLVDAAKAYDLALIMAETLLYGVLTLVFLLVGDVLYAWADPRVRYE
ncbi:MAG: ABC transporter permease [Planctomycetota bacterium]|nr:ABC transporter permease [Planctomycetota bacterium]